jgi:hypothetical protein
MPRHLEGQPFTVRAATTGHTPRPDLQIRLQVAQRAVSEAKRLRLLPPALVVPSATVPALVKTPHIIETYDFDAALGITPHRPLTHLDAQNTEALNSQEGSEKIDTRLLGGTWRLEESLIAQESSLTQPLSLR